MPELAESLPNITTHPPIDPAQDQRRLTLALVQCLTRLAAHQDDQHRSPLLILIEDLHWCDEASLEVLLALARRTQSQPILLLLTYRSDEAPAELATFLLALNRERLGTEVSLTRLTPSDVDAQIHAIFSLPRPVDAAFVRTVYVVTEGNPFFVEETLKALLAAGDIAPSNDAWDAQPFRELRLPRSVQLAVQRRLDQVGPAAREVLRLAAVAGRRFDFDLLQALTGHREAELVRLIKELINAQLVVEESADVSAFRHSLTRAAVEADLLARERRALHRAIAETLERISAGAHDRHVADLAEHYYAAEVWASARHMPRPPASRRRRYIRGMQPRNSLPARSKRSGTWGTTRQPPSIRGAAMPTSSSAISMRRSRTIRGRWKLHEPQWIAVPSGRACWRWVFSGVAAISPKPAAIFGARWTWHRRCTTRPRSATASTAWATGT